MAGTHHIGTIEVNLQVPDTSVARDLQQEISTLCRTELPRKLEPLLDDICGDSVVRIDRLELQLEAFRDEDDFRRNFVSSLQESLREQLDSEP